MQTNKHIGRVLKPFELDHIGSNEVPMVRFGLAVKRFPSAKAKIDFIYYVAYRDVAERVFKYANQKGLPVEIDFTQQSRTFENVVEKFMPWASLDKQSGQQTDATAHDTPVENEATLDDFEQQLPNDYEVY